MGTRDQYGTFNCSTNMRVWHFCMETLKSITEALHLENFLSSINLTKVYIHNRVLPSHRHFPCFAMEDWHYQFMELTFGLQQPLGLLQNIHHPYCSTQERGNTHLYVPGQHSREFQQSHSSHGITEVTMWCLREHDFLINMRKRSL